MPRSRSSAARGRRGRRLCLAGSCRGAGHDHERRQRLQQTVDQISTDLVKLRQRDRAAARALQAELDDLEDEITYLKVKLRGSATCRAPTTWTCATASRICAARVNGTDTYAGRYSTGATSSDRTLPERLVPRRSTATPAGVVPTGTELDVRLETALSSDTAQVEDRFEATTVVDLRENGRVLIPAGSRVRGVVTAVENAGRVDRKGELSLSFDQITVNGRNYPIRGTVTEALEAGGYRKTPGRSAPARRSAASSAAFSAA